MLELWRMLSNSILTESSLNKIVVQSIVKEYKTKVVENAKK